MALSFAIVARWATILLKRLSVSDYGQGVQGHLSVNAPRRSWGSKVVEGTVEALHIGPGQRSPARKLVASSLKQTFQPL